MELTSDTDNSTQLHDVHIISYSDCVDNECNTTFQIAAVRLDNDASYEVAVSATDKLYQYNATSDATVGKVNVLQTKHNYSWYYPSSFI